IAHAASTALPPFANTRAPAVAASGLPVTAIQWRPCSGGLTVRVCGDWARVVATATAPSSSPTRTTMALVRMPGSSAGIRLGRRLPRPAPAGRRIGDRGPAGGAEGRSMKTRRPRTLLAAFLLVPAAALADEGMWTFDNPPL